MLYTSIVRSVWVVKKSQKGNWVIKKCVLVWHILWHYTQPCRQGHVKMTRLYPTAIRKEELLMGLNNLFCWSTKAANKAVSACGSACGVGDPKPTEPKPSACGSACGAGDKK